MPGAHSQSEFRYYQRVVLLGSNGLPGETGVEGRGRVTFVLATPLDRRCGGVILPIEGDDAE